MTPTPDFDYSSPWGRYRPTFRHKCLLGVAHRLPGFLAPLTTLLRRPVKYGLMTPLDLDVWGLKLRVLPRGNMSEQKILTAPQLFDREEFLLMKKLLRPGGVFVDVGANAGIYSFWANRCMKGTGRVIAVEPDPEMRRRIAFNIATNRLRGIEVHAVALSDHEGRATLYVNESQRGTNTLDSAEAKRTGGERVATEVEVTTLMRLLEKCAVGAVDVLKLDIEGHEPSVLGHFMENAPDALLPRAIITEFDDNTAQAVLGLAGKRGYRRLKATRLNLLFERN